MFQNMESRQTFCPKRQKKQNYQRKLHNEELHNSRSLTNMIREPGIGQTVQGLATLWAVRGSNYSAVKKPSPFPYPFRPAVELKLSPLQCLLTSLFEGRGTALTTLPNLAPKLRMSTAVPLLSPRPWTPMACNVATFNFDVMTTVITTKKMYVVCFLWRRDMLRDFCEETCRKVAA